MGSHSLPNELVYFRPCSGPVLWARKNCVKLNLAMHSRCNNQLNDVGSPSTLTSATLMNEYSDHRY